MIAATRPFALAFLVAWLSGCTSVWRSSFVPLAATPEFAAPSPSVEIREVEWDRLQATLRNIRDRHIASSTPLREWPTSERTQMKASLLSALEVTHDPGSVEVLGRSDFRSSHEYQPASADRADLEAFARSIGATDVVWSHRRLGKAHTAVKEPMEAWSIGADVTWDRRRGRWRSFPSSEHSTTFVPVRIDADEFACIVYYLRIINR